jgi:hypothetical protein
MERFLWIFFGSSFSASIGMLGEGMEKAVVLMVRTRNDIGTIYAGLSCLHSHRFDFHCIQTLSEETTKTWMPRQTILIQAPLLGENFHGKEMFLSAEYQTSREWLQTIPLDDTRTFFAR